MRKLIRADIGRILRKKSFWVIAVIMLILVSAVTLSDLNEDMDKGFSFIVGASDGISYIGLLLGLLVVLGVYADDFKATAYINSIGRGLSREKMVLARFIDSALIMLGYYIAGIILVFILKAFSGVSPTSTEYLYLFLRFMGDYICNLTGVMIASVFFYLSENATMGVMVYLSIGIIIPLIIEICLQVPVVQKYHLDRLYITGAISAVNGCFIMGSVLEGIMKLLLTLVVYIGGSVGASIYVFKKKELDF